MWRCLRGAENRGEWREIASSGNVQKHVEEMVFWKYKKEEDGQS